jgi:hypothetical protein
MAKTLSLNGDDLKVKYAPTESAARQRGAYPSDDLIPLQFKMPPEFVKRFKMEALNRGMKLNALFEACFEALLKA